MWSPSCTALVCACARVLSSTTVHEVAIVHACNYVLTDELRDTYVFNAAVVTVGMAGSIAAAVVLATCMAGLQLAKAAREPILKLVETRAAPELTLRPEHRWHLFLSHIWATGQALAHAVAKQIHYDRDGDNVVTNAVLTRDVSVVTPV